MRLYIDRIAPNVRRVLMFIAEKNIEISLVDVDVQHGENRRAGFLAKNPWAQVPVLELPDGTCISESVAICRYLDEFEPAASLFGSDPLARAEIEMWQRRVEFGALIPAVEYGHHSSPFFGDTVRQNTAWASHNRDLFSSTWERVDEALEDREFLAPSGFSIADVTAFVGATVGTLWGLAVPATLHGVVAWRDRVASRPSAVVVTY